MQNVANLLRWVYIIEGLFSIAVAVVVWFGLPTDPGKAWFLNAEEREMMRLRAIQRQKYMGKYLIIPIFPDFQLNLMYRLREILLGRISN